MKPALFVVWWLIGVAGFLWWWRTRYHITVGEVILSLCLRIVGPLNWADGLADVPSACVSLPRRHP